LLAKKVGYRCSNPFCRKSTIGSNADGSGTINIGEAAHITAAEVGGPRYNVNLSLAQRKDESNGIWLCRNHAAMIDRDVNFFTEDLLKKWKFDAEKEANERLNGIIPTENVRYYLRIIYDDLKDCSETVNNLVIINKNIVFNPEELPIVSEYEKKIESVVGFIGVDYASRIRKCFKAICAFREILKEELLRLKDHPRGVSDLQAVEYGHRLKTFLLRMEEYDIKGIVEVIGKLFTEDI